MNSDTINCYVKSTKAKIWHKAERITISNIDLKFSKANMGDINEKAVKYFICNISG